MCKKIHIIEIYYRRLEIIKIRRFTTKDIALIAIFAALQAILGLLPFTITIGVSGQITLGVVGGPLIGILLGPIVGGTAVLIGSLVGVFLNPAGAIFGVLTVLPPSLGAVGAGYVRLNRGFIPGAIVLGSLAAFYAHPFGRESILYPWLHIIAMIVAFSPLTRIAASTFTSPNIKSASLGIPVAAFVGTLTDHMFGSGLGIWYFSPMLTPEIWNFLLFVYPIERIVAVLLVSLIAIPVYHSLKRAGLIEVSK